MKTWKRSAIKSFILVFFIVLIIFAITIKNDTSSSELKADYGWHTQHMQIEDLHTFSTGSSQKIALIDSGISKFQSGNLLESNIEESYSRVDENGHGTIMYSLIKGYGNEILGIAPNVEVISLNVLSSDSSLEPKVMADAIREAIKLKCTIINLSLGSYQTNDEVTKAIDEAYERGIVIVAATGDYSTTEMMFPANKSNVISVGSISQDLKVSNFSNDPLGSTINIPGEDIKSLNKQKQIEFTSGTSQSSVLLSGYIALLKDYAEKKDIDIAVDDLLFILEEVKHSNDFLSAFKLLLNK